VASSGLPPVEAVRKRNKGALHKRNKEVLNLPLEHAGDPKEGPTDASKVAVVGQLLDNDVNAASTSGDSTLSMASFSAAVAESLGRGAEDQIPQTSGRSLIERLKAICARKVTTESQYKAPRRRDSVASFSSASSHTGNMGSSFRDLDGELSNIIKCAT